MELWLAALVIIVAMVAVGTVVGRTWRPQGPHHSLGPVLAARLVAVVIITALAAAANIAAGPLAAFAVALVGVLIAIMLLIRTGYARTAPIARTRR
jgi:hypothetical protein